MYTNESGRRSAVKQKLNVGPQDMNCVESRKTMNTAFVFCFRVAVSFNCDMNSYDALLYNFTF